MSSINSKKIGAFFLGLFFVSTFQTISAADVKGTPVTSPGKEENTGIVYVCKGSAPGECTFDDLLKAVDKILNWGTIFALQFSVIIIAYAGYLYMLSEGNPGKLKEANDMFTRVAIGIAWIIGAWLVVSLIMNSLGVKTPITFK